MKIMIAETDMEIQKCHAVMRELRPHLEAQGFVELIRRQQAEGYRLAAVLIDDTPASVAGYRVAENLAWGRYLYIDDFVTRSQERSKGYGSALLAWLKQEARRHGCRQVHCDSGMQRVDAHRFYEREGMTKAGFHFAL